VIVFMTYLLGLVGSAVHIYALTHTCDARMKKITALSGIFFAGYFFMLNLPIAGFCTLVSVLRYYMAAGKTGWYWIPFSIFYIAVAVIIPPQNLMHLYPAIASVIGTFALFNMRGLPFRILMISLTFLWVIYGVYSEAYIVAVKEAFLFVASAYAIYKLVYSHSIVPGGLDVISYVTRLIPGTSLIMRVATRERKSISNG